MTLRYLFPDLTRPISDNEADAVLSENIDQDYADRAGPNEFVVIYRERFRTAVREHNARFAEMTR